MSRPPLALAGVVVALGGLLAAGAALPAPAPVRAPSAGEVPVVGTRLVCPDLRQAAGALTTAVAAGLAGDAGGPRTAVAEQRRLVGQEQAEAEGADLAIEPGGPTRSGVGAGLTDAAVEVRAAGEGAAGLSAVARQTASTPSVRGLALLPCTVPTTRSWLVGGSTTVGESAELVLANPDAVPAVVDVEVLTAEGPADARPGQGITVPEGGRLVVPLDTLAPDRSRLAVHVVATRGRVAAALRHTRSDGVVARGLAYAARAEQAAEEVVVPGLPAGPGGRAVWVANPGDLDVTVAVEVTTSDGQFVPAGLDAVPVPPRSTAAVDLSAVLRATPAAVRVRATGGPVVAAGVAEDAGTGDVRDLAYASPAGPLGGAALVPSSTPADTVLLLSALSGDAVADLALRPVSGGPAVAVPGRRLDVPGGRTLAVPLASLLPAGAAGPVALQVTPDPAGSPLVAGLAVRPRPVQGPLLALLSLDPVVARVAQPPVVRDPAVGAGTR